MRTKGNGSNFEILKKQLLKEVQKTNNTDLTEMLVWLFMQEDEFDAAFIYSKALDKRLNENGHRMYELLISLMKSSLQSSNERL